MCSSRASQSSVTKSMRDLIETYQPSDWFSRFWPKLALRATAERKPPVPPSGFSLKQAQRGAPVGQLFFCTVSAQGTNIEVGDIQD